MKSPLPTCDDSLTRNASNITSCRAICHAIGEYVTRAPHTGHLSENATHRSFVDSVSVRSTRGICEKPGAMSLVRTDRSELLPRNLYPRTIG